MNSLFIQGAYLHWEEIESDHYIKQIPALSNTKQVFFRQPITFLVGENGTGKSTLLEALAISFGFNPEGGTTNFNFSTRETHSPLSEAITLIKGPKRPKHNFFLRAESMYNVASQIDDYQDNISEVYYQRYGGRSLHEQSHGESFLSLILHNFTANGLYLLDEPEAALSPQRQLTLLMQLHQLTNQGAQFIIATHSPILLGLPGAAILSFDGKEVTKIAYEETESYQITELFINHRPMILNQLLKDEE